MHRQEYKGIGAYLIALQLDTIFPHSDVIVCGSYTVNVPIAHERKPAQPVTVKTCKVNRLLARAQRDMDAVNRSFGYVPIANILTASELAQVDKTRKENAKRRNRQAQGLARRNRNNGNR